jgi:hypothetical protein
METFLSKVLTVIGWLFVPLWLTGVVGGILLGIGQQRGLIEKERVERIAMRMAILTACYIFSGIGTSLLSSHVTQRAWETMLAHHPSRLVLDSPAGGEAREINDRDAIDQFLTIIVKTKRVWAHHSHPIPVLTMSFPEYGRAGSLGRDSEHLHEFWGPVGQFRSEELDRWLEKHWISKSGCPSDKLSIPKPIRLKFFFMFDAFDTSTCRRRVVFAVYDARIRFLRFVCGLSANYPQNLRLFCGYAECAKS